MKNSSSKRGGMTTYAGGASGMSDKEYLNDGLISQKQITAAYNTFAGECKNVQMRDTFLSILREEHEIQTELFTSLEQNGWYQAEQAPAAKVNKAYKQYVGGASATMSTGTRSTGTRNSTTVRGTAAGRSKGGKASVKATGRSTTGKFVAKENDGYNGSPGRYSSSSDEGSNRSTASKSTTTKRNASTKGTTARGTAAGRSKGGKASVKATGRSTTGKFVSKENDGYNGSPGRYSSSSNEDSKRSTDSKSTATKRNASTKSTNARGTAAGRSKGGKASVKATGRSTTGKFVSKKNDGYNGSPGRY